MEHTGLKKWEIALVLALCLSLCWGLVFGEVRCCAWWGVMYPELLQTPESAQTFAPAGDDGGAGGVVLRSRLWEWVTEYVLPALRK